MAPHVKIQGVKTEKRIAYATITTDGCAGHRVLHVIAENEDVFRASSFEVTPKQRQYPIKWLGLRPGLYEVSATLIDADGKIKGSARALLSIPL